MQIVLEKIIDDKLAQLVLADDNITVQVIYDGVVIDESAGGTWNNLNGSDLEDCYLTSIINSFITDDSSDTELELMRGELD